MSRSRVGTSLHEVGWGGPLGHVPDGLLHLNFRSHAYQVCGYTSAATKHDVNVRNRNVRLHKRTEIGEEPRFIVARRGHHVNSRERVITLIAETVKLPGALIHSSTVLVR